MGVAWMTAERFARKTKRVGECLIWQGKGRIGNGYGKAGYQGEQWLAHRLAYHFANGPIPEGAVVRHSCDTPLCVEPAHLLLGTHADNVGDKVQRRRHRFTDRHPNAQLSSDAVRAIRARAAAGAMQKDLAKEYRVSKQQISKIVRGQRWAAIAVKGD